VLSSFTKIQSSCDRSWAGERGGPAPSSLCSHRLSHSFYHYCFLPLSFSLSLIFSSTLPYLIFNSVSLSLSPSGFFRFAETVTVSSFSSSTQTKELRKRIDLLSKTKTSKSQPSQSSPLNPNSSSNSNQVSRDNSPSQPESKNSEYGISSLPTLPTSASSENNRSEFQKSYSSSSLNLHKKTHSLSGTSTPTFSTNPSRFKVVSSKLAKGKSGVLGLGVGGSRPGSRAGSRAGSRRGSLVGGAKILEGKAKRSVEEMPGNEKSIPVVGIKGASKPTKADMSSSSNEKGRSKSKEGFGRIIDAIAIDEREKEGQQKMKSKKSKRERLNSKGIQDTEMKGPEEVDAYADMLASYLKLSDLPPPTDLHSRNHSQIQVDSSDEGSSDENSDSEYVYDIYYRDFGGGIASHMPSRAAPSGTGSSEIGLKPSSIVGGDFLPAETSPGFSYDEIGISNQEKSGAGLITGTYGHLTSFDSEDEDEEDETEGLDFSNPNSKSKNGNGKVGVNPEDGDSWDEGEDEDSNDEDFYRNDYPEQEVDDDDEFEDGDDGDSDVDEDGYRRRRDQEDTIGGDNYDLTENDYGAEDYSN